MRRLLDHLSFKKNRYARPNQDWICGHLAEGHACPLGPDQRGRCRNTGECTPGKSGDRFTCTRREADGGRCTEGPRPDGACAHLIPPCQPIPSLRRTRGQFAWLMVALTLGVICVLLGGQNRRKWINPGTLTAHHSTSATKCEDCHSQSKSEVLPVKVGGVSAKHLAGDSQLCLKCHALGAQPLSPHGLAAPALAAFTSHAKSEKSQAPLALKASSAIRGLSHAKSGDVACATCHQEHHGKDHDLKHLSDAQCQVCHSVQFESLAKGHPEFANYPYNRRTRIYFDHATHLQQHFPASKETAPTSCASCHEPGAAGRFMQVKTFNAMCASCHAGQIKGEGSTGKGVAFFAVPGLDAETLAAKGFSVGEWPKFAEAKATPFMEMLLSRQPAAHAAIEKLQGVDLLDLTKATPDQLAAAEQYAWAVKWLFAILVSDGQSFLSKELKDDVPMTGWEMPQAQLQKAQGEWMPHLLTDVANYQKGVRPPLPPKPTPTPTPPPSKGKENNGKTPPVTAPAAPKPAPSDDSILGGDDILSAVAPSTPAPAATPGDDILGGGGAEAVAAATAAPVPSATPAVAAETAVAPGAWFASAESFTLFYRPLGHADPLLGAWLTGSAKLQNATATVETRHAFTSLRNPQSAGLCMKCHTTETSGALMQVNWSPAKADSNDRPFTTFSHMKHFSLAGDAGCQSCHALNAKSEYGKFFSPEADVAAASGALAFHSNFTSILKLQCAECHKRDVAGDNCTVCHRYHTAPASHEFASIGQLLK